MLPIGKYFVVIMCYYNYLFPTFAKKIKYLIISVLNYYEYSGICYYSCSPPTVNVGMSERN